MTFEHIILTLFGVGGFMFLALVIADYRERQRWPSRRKEQASSNLKKRTQ